METAERDVKLSKQQLRLRSGQSSHSKEWNLQSEKYEATVKIQLSQQTLPDLQTKKGKLKQI